MLRRLTFAAAMFVCTHAWAQGVFPYPAKVEVSKTFMEARDVLDQFNKVTAQLDIDSWNAPAEFRSRQKLLLGDTQEGLNDIRDDIEDALESNSGAHTSSQSLLDICTKVRDVYHFVENAGVYYDAFQANPSYSEAMSLSELAGSSKMASIACQGILTVQVAADQIRAKSCHQHTPH
jgi:hypothetical protein